MASIIPLPSFNFGTKKSSAQSDYSRSGQQDVISPEWWKTGLEDMAVNFGDPSASSKPYMNQALSGISGIASGGYASDFLKSAVNPALQGIAMNSGQIGQGINYQLDPNAPQVASQNITATSAFDNAQPYRDAYGTGVLDPALADYDTGVSRAANAFRAGSIGGGAQAAGSRPVAAGVLAADAARGRGALGAQIRSDILDKSFGFGGGDAAMRLSADTNTAQMAQAASLANAQIQQARDLANLQGKMQADQTKIGINNDMASLVQQQGQNAVGADQQSMSDQLALLQASGIPFEQAMAMLQAKLGIYNAATPGFGTTNTESGTETQKGKSSGFSFGVGNYAKI